MEQRTRRSRASGHFHAVRFYQDDESLCRIVADFLGQGLGRSVSEQSEHAPSRPAPPAKHRLNSQVVPREARLLGARAPLLGRAPGGQPALVVATPEHCRGIIEELRARHVDIAAVQAAGDLLLLDAREALSSFMVDGRPDTTRFTSSMTAAIDRVCHGRTDCNVHVYGQMVDLLWKDGLTVAAIRLEILWNQLAMTHDFSLVCGYAMGNFYKDAQVEDICRHHSHAFSPDGAAAPIDLEMATINEAQESLDRMLRM
jgi:hypothetical protein